MGDTNKCGRYRAWVLALNNYTEEDENHWSEELPSSGKIKYILYQHEIGPENGTPHLQGFVYTKNAMTFTAIKKLFPKAHIEPMRGTHEHNVIYCTKLKSKAGDVFEWGKPPHQGERMDIHDMKDAVKKGATMEQLIEGASSYQGLRTAELLMKYQPAPPERKKEVTWLWGDTGVGKTRSAVSRAGPGYWISSENLKWWDGYSGQKSIIIDEFRGDMCTLHVLLRILDRYPYRVELKGSSAWLLAEKVIITSCYPPEACYKNVSGDSVGQLLRRIDTVLHLEPDDSGLWDIEIET